jgi:penicillin-binding protein 1C
MWDVSGTSGAAPVWAALMNYLHKKEPSRAPAPPAGVVQQQVVLADAAGRPIEAARSEWFIRGTEQSLFAIDSGAAGADGIRAGGQKRLKDSAHRTDSAAARIIAPANGTIVALDPDIPPNRQRLSFTAEGHKLRWRMDGKEFAQGGQVQWLPWPGRHVVQLMDASGKVADEIKLEVRGAGVREAGARSGATAPR